jgi:hypothetical protein
MLGDEVMQPFKMIFIFTHPHTIKTQTNLALSKAFTVLGRINAIRHL